jgi:hypothetical protein
LHFSGQPSRQGNYTRFYAAGQIALTEAGDDLLGHDSLAQLVG